VDIAPHAIKVPRRAAGLIQLAQDAGR
jgi:hypothetical protein